MYKVSIVKSQEHNNLQLLKDNIREALSLLGPIDEILPRDKVFLLKPNVTIDRPGWEIGFVTNPLVVEALIEIINEYSPKEIIIGEGTAVGLDTFKCYEAYGYPEIAQRTGAKLVDFNLHEFVEIPIPHARVLKKVQVSKYILESDIVINLPVLKTHVATQMTGCMKNLNGILPPHYKKLFHLLGMGDCISDLNSVIKPHLQLMDGTISHQGDGPVNGEPVNLGLIFAGTDGKAVDTVGTKVMGLQVDMVDVLTKSWEVKPSEAPIEVLGERIEEVRKEFIPATKAMPILNNINILNGGACNGCREGLRVALGRMIDAGLINNIQALDIAIGKFSVTDTNPARPLMAIGNCPNIPDNGDRVQGCPPQIFLITDELREHGGEKRIFGCKETFFHGLLDNYHG